MRPVTLPAPEVASRAPQATPRAWDAPAGRGLGRGLRLEEGLAVLALLAVLLADLALIRFGVDALDEGYFLEQATRVVRGDLPYRDFDSLYTPALLYVHAALLSLFGEPHALVLRAVGLVARALLAGGLYLLCRPLARPAFAVLPGLYVLLALDQVPLMWEPHPGWPSAALTVLVAWAFTRLPRLSDSRRTVWLIAMGALAGVALVERRVR